MPTFSKLINGPPVDAVVRGVNHYMSGVCSSSHIEGYYAPFVPMLFIWVEFEYKGGKRNTIGVQWVNS